MGDEDAAIEGRGGNFLGVGDELTLYSEDHNGYLGAEGFADNRMLLYQCFGDAKPIKFNDCLFRILPQYTYDAHKALKKHKKKMAAKAAAEAEAAADAAKSKKGKKGKNKLEVTEEEEDADEGEEEEEAGPNPEEGFTMNKLHEQFEQEIESNKAMVEEANGNNITYGMIVQLLHIKSNKFVCMRPKIVAAQERSCSAMDLCEEGGTSGVYFRVESRYKFREQGAPVLKTDEIYLMNPKVEQYIHVAGMNLPMQRELREVNASQALRSRLKIICHSTHNPDKHKSTVGNQIIRLYHPESDTCLCAGAFNKHGKRQVQYLGFQPEEISPSDEIEKNNSMGLWEVEKVDTLEGGPLEYINQGMPCQYRFRNVATNLYLSGRIAEKNFDVNSDEEQDEEEDEEGNTIIKSGVEETGPKWELAIEDDKRTEDSLFTLETTAFSASNSIDANAPIRVQHLKSGRFIHAGEAKQNKQDSFEGSVASKPTLGAEALDEHTLVLQTVEEEECRDLFFVKGVLPFLESYISRMNNMYQKAVDEDVPPPPPPEVKTLGVADLTASVTGEVPDASGVEVVKEKAVDISELTGVERVKAEMAKAKATGSSTPTPVDVGASSELLTSIEGNMILRTLTDLIFFVTKTESDDPVFCEGLPQRPRQKLLREQDFGALLVRMLEAPFQGGQKYGPYELPELLIGHPIVDISQLCYRLLKHMCKDYRRNEFYLAPHIDLFIRQSCETGDDNDLYAEATISGLLSGNKQLLEEKIDITNIGLFVDLLLEQDKDARYVDLLMATCSCQGEAIGSNQEALCELMLGNPKTLKELCIRTSLDKKGQPMIMFIDYKLGSPTPLQQFLEEEEGGEDGMIEYYTSLLGLFAEICFARNYKGIYQIDALYQYEVVLACMASKDLPYDLRARFTRLLLCLHIDKEPQVVVQVPNYTRTNTNSTPLMGFVEGEGARDFKDIKAFVVKYFDEMAPCQKAWEHHKNQMSLNVLEVAVFLTEAGFYTVGKDVRSMVNPLINCMDGTVDLTYPPEQMKPDPNNTLRYLETEGTVPIMTCKVKMCEILLLLSNIRLDSRITDLLRVFAGTKQQGLTEISSQDFNDIFVGGDMDLQQLSEKDVVAILLDLTMYQHNKLVNIAFSNLVHHYTQKHELIVASERIQLLTDTTLIELHDQVKRDIRRLRSLVETEELWLGEDDPQDRAGELMLLLSSMLSHCEEPEPPEGMEGGKKRRKSMTQEAQEASGRGSVRGSFRGSTTSAIEMPEVDIKASRELLRNLGAHKAIVEVLEIERLLTVDGGLDLLCVCHRFLQAFAEDSAANTEEIAEFMDLFMEQLGSPDSTVVTAAAETLTVIGGAELTKELVEACLNGKGHVMTPVPVIDGKAMAQCSINLACLELLKDCIKSGGVYNKKAQNLVMKVLMDPKRLERGPIQHQWLHDKGAAKLFGNAADSAMGSSFTPETLLLESANISILELLCECCMGKNGLAQAKCQGIFSLQQLAEHMENLKKHYVVKKPLMYFTLRVYLEASAGISEELQHSTLFKIFTTDIEYVVEDAVVDDDESNYLFESLFPCIRNYFRDFVTSAKGSEEQIEMARSILSSLVTLFECCRKGWQKGLVADIGRQVLRQERLFTNIMVNGEWQPRTHKIQRMFNFHSDEDPDANKGGDEEEEVQEEGPKKKTPKTEFQLMMKAMIENKDIIDQAEYEFEEMCQAFKDIEETTIKAFKAGTKITFPALIESLVQLVDINDFPLDMDLSQAGIKMLRKCVEMENPDTTLPASEWETEDWEDWEEIITQWQGTMNDLGCVKLIMNLVGQSPHIPIVMDAIDLGVTLLLGGNETVQDGFYEASRLKGANNFFRRVDELLQQSWDEMKAIGADQTIVASQQIGGAAKEEEEEPEEAEEGDEETEGNPDGEDGEGGDEAEESDEEEDDGFDENKNATIVFRFIQLLCEGHNQRCQRMVQAQTAQHVSFDLVQKTLTIVKLLCCEMSADLDEDRMEAACQGLDTLTEVIQGPCASAQKCLIDNKVLDICTQIMADPFDLAFDDPDHPLIMDVKEKTVTLLISLLEGVSSRKTFRLFGDVLEFEVLKKRMAYVYRKCMVDSELDPLTLCDSRLVPEDIYFGDLNEAFAIYMLMATLATHSPAARAAINPMNYEGDDKVVVEFFLKNAGSIEIKWEDKLERVYFPIPPICTYLTEASRQKVLWGVNRESPGEKMMGFFTYTEELQAEMVHLEKMSQVQAISWLSENFELTKSTMLNIAWLINFLLIYDIEATESTNPFDTSEHLYKSIRFRTSWIEYLVIFAGVIQTFLCLTVFCGVVATNGPLAIDNAWTTKIRLLGKPSEDDPEPEEGSLECLLRLGPEEAGIFDGEAGVLATIGYYLYSAKFLAEDNVVLMHFSYVLMSIAANLITPFIHAYHLLELIYASVILQNVLLAVTFNGVQLLMTALLMVVVLYFYTIIGFLVLRNNFFLPDDFPDLRPCDTMFNCFLVTIREGLINGGGMADYLQPRSIADKPNFMARFFFDLSFFCVILVILMNVIFGIIIDTFSALRDMTESKINDMKTTCFMCSIDRYTFDRQGTPFEIHIKEEHNMWKYLFYLVYLKTKDASEYTGLESYVAGLLEEEDVSFYPVNKSMCLDADDEEEDPFQVASMSKFDHLTKELGFLKNTVMDMKSESGSTQATTAEFNNNLMAKLSSMQEQQNAIMTELNNANNI